jgi:hypothetical protein
MSDRPTPETDAKASPHIGFYSCATVPANFARALEQERDEAREALKHIEEYGTEEINAAVELRQKLAQVLVDLDSMQDQRDLAMKVIKRLELERYEAREALRAVLELANDIPDESLYFWKVEFHKVLEEAKYDPLT